MSTITDEVAGGIVATAQEPPSASRHVIPGTEVPVFQSRDGAIKEIESRVDLIARSHVPVFITGESGTGKEVIARLIHQKSQKAPFVAINCAALPKDVIENELFGHERGAFTGALIKKSGCFELAHGGTLFLDEVAEMHPQTQAKLLRAIETKVFRRLGGSEEVSVDTRIIAATNKDPLAAMSSGLLREDLFYRLSVIELSLPPLRNRKADIVPLLEHYMLHLSKKHNGKPKRFAVECLELLTGFDWPGNVRELKNLVERLVLLCQDDVVEIRHLPARMVGRKIQAPIITIELGTTVDNAERLLITRTLEHVGDNKAKAARLLGVSRKTLYDKLKHYEVTP